jgi:hypothetical protein
MLISIIFVGCFNGTEHDDVDNVAYHVRKYGNWTSGQYEYRCGDNGIELLRCIVAMKVYGTSGNAQLKPIYVGSAWIDENGHINVCR